jgi:hypothetical protein
MEVAVDALDRARQRAALGALDFSRVLAQHRRDPGQPERGVDVRLRFAGHDLAALELGQAIFIERQATRQGTHAQLDVVAFRPGEVEQGRTELVLFDHAQIHLNAAPGDDAGFSFTPADHALD